jgi:hypothetical protein
MIRKGQVNGVKQGDSVSQVKFIKLIFGITAWRNTNDTERSSLKIFATEPGNASKSSVKPSRSVTPSPRLHLPQPTLGRFFMCSRTAVF